MHLEHLVYYYFQSFFILENRDFVLTYIKPKVETAGACLLTNTRLDKLPQIQDNLPTSLRIMGANQFPMTYNVDVCEAFVRIEYDIRTPVFVKDSLLFGINVNMKQVGKQQGADTTLLENAVAALDNPRSESKTHSHSLQINLYGSNWEIKTNQPSD